MVYVPLYVPAAWAVLTFKLAPTFKFMVPDAFNVEKSTAGNRVKLLTVMAAPGPVNVVDVGNVIVTAVFGFPVMANSAALPGLDLIKFTPV